MNVDLQQDVRQVVKGSLGFVGEFKEFISRGNVIDLAVGVVIGGAFGGIVSSLVKDIIMPPIGYLTSGHDFASLKIVLKEASTKLDPADPTHLKMLPVPEVAIAYGAFLNTVLSFLIISFAIFLLVKAVNVLRRQSAEKAAAEAPLSTQEKLLMEIRDLLAGHTQQPPQS